jgi:uncharacterized SAM-binding protein YcdF (DUF218 family)
MITALPDHADLLFVFGTRSPRPAHLAADLLQRSVAPVAVLTGGINPQTGQIEAQAHAAILAGYGLPPARWLIEATSTNTLENVTHAIPLIPLLDSVRRIVTICKWYHAERAVMTLKRHMPAGIRYYVQTYSAFGITPGTAAGIAQAQAEAHKIITYQQSQHIAPVSLMDDYYI